MTSIDELMQRIDDDDGTFTSEEVRSIVEHVERKALNDIYNKSRIAQNAQRGAEIVEQSRQAMAQLIALVEPVTEPVFKVVNDGSQQEPQA